MLEAKAKAVGESVAGSVGEGGTPSTAFAIRASAAAPPARLDLLCRGH